MVPTFRLACFLMKEKIHTGKGEAVSALNKVQGSGCIKENGGIAAGIRKPRP
jgi:hypothetical protein